MTIDSLMSMLMPMPWLLIAMVMVTALVMLLKGDYCKRQSAVIGIELKAPMKCWQNGQAVARYGHVQRATCNIRRHNIDLCLT